MSLIVKNNIKQSTDLSVSEEFIEALEKKVLAQIKEAENRAKENGRRTLYSRDI